MGLFVSTLWNRCVEVLFPWISASITSTTAQATLRRSLGFLSLRNYSLQRMLMTLRSQLDLTSLMGILTGNHTLFVGANEEVNCNEINCYDTVTKKNTQISRLSVLSVVCYDYMVLVNPIVASRAIIINIFASCYV